MNITETQEGIQALEDLGTQGSGSGFLMLYGAMVLGVLISSFMVRVHPVFLVLYIIMLTVSIVLAVFLGNAYSFISQNYPFNDINGQTLAQSQPMIDVLMRNIVRITLAVGALSMIVVFAKVFGPGDSGGGP
jgi:small-conductance mechanosensitive channel